MERIIITEVDNTSNVEALSSYDVVYVPGFSMNGATPSFTGEQSLYRTPTLVTSKYEFLKLFGQNGVDVCPTFPKDQPYPIATQSTETTTGKYGFPDYAIPGYVPVENPAVVAGVATIDLPEGATPEEIILAIEEGNIYTDGFIANDEWTPEEAVTYYYADTESDPTTIIMKSIDVLHEEYEDKIIFTSSTSPSELSWMLDISDHFIYTSETEIGFDMDGDTRTTVKTYYVAQSAPAMMFYGPGDATDGDADPGYRYALYLLSLGIPIYYEQMNAEFEAIDMNDPAMAEANPKAQGWFEQINDEYVRTNDTEVLTGKTYYGGADISVESMYRGLEARFFDNDENAVDYSFDSMGDYAIKYITSGGYPTFEYGPLADPDPTVGKIYGTSPLAEAMIRLAAKRSDALALIDHTNNPNRTIYLADDYSVIRRVREEFANITTIEGSYGTMFTPWYECTHKAITGGTNSSFNNQVPGSLAYLSALAQQLRNYNPWLAVSGVSRGPVPYCSSLHTNYTLTNNVADSYQILPGDPETLGQSSISINPITYIRNYGYCIWGNRTLRNNADGTKSTSFLNIRSLVADIKKKLYEASLSLMFEQNTDILWINFKSIITPLLDTMITNYILSDYVVTRYLVDPESGSPVPSYKVLANIRIMPINSVEVFDLQVTLENSEIMVSETE